MLLTLTVEGSMPDLKFDILQSQPWEQLSAVASALNTLRLTLQSWPVLPKYCLMSCKVMPETCHLRAERAAPKPDTAADSE